MEVEQDVGATPAAPLPAARPVPAGATFGVEEEFHLVDPATYRLTPSPALAKAVLARESGRHLHAEITTTQLEAVTGYGSFLPVLSSDGPPELRADRVLLPGLGWAWYAEP